MVATTDRRLSCNLVEEFRWFTRAARAPRLRTLREFAEAEIVLPDGPHEGERFRCATQPYSALYFDAVDSGNWSRICAVGPTQSGKTLTCCVIPLCYHLFELSENVVFGVSQLDMMKDKWFEDLLPVIERSRYRELLPTRGSGSRGGVQSSIRFGNGTTLRFMTGGGDDKTRSAFTTRVVITTETDGFDQKQERSRESNQVSQLEGRTRAYSDRARIYHECTASIEEGYIWQAWEHGTKSAIYQPCRHCGAFVHLVREDLVGWAEAEDELAAEESARWCCPSCGAEWSEDDRRASAQGSKLVHRGQEIDDKGVIHGDLPRAKTLGFRWSAPDNLFISPGVIGQKEWQKTRAVDEDDRETELRQQFFALPAEPKASATIGLNVGWIMERTTDDPRGEIPRNCEVLSVGVDVGLHYLHWLAIAWRPHATGTIIDYGVVELHADELGGDRALNIGLRDLRDSILEIGWLVPATGMQRKPDAVFIDSQYQTDIVHAFVLETQKTAGDRYYAVQGQGSGKEQPKRYRKPKQKGKQIVRFGEEYHIARLPTQTGKPRAKLVEINADYWKTWLHNRLAVPPAMPGALTLFQATRITEHNAIARHFTAEEWREEWKPGVGVVGWWERINRNNHWLDCGYMTCAAGHLAGVRLDAGVEQAEQPKDLAEVMNDRKKLRRKVRQ